MPPVNILVDGINQASFNFSFTGLVTNIHKSTKQHCKGYELNGAHYE